LFAAGAVLSGYDWLRARRLPSSPAPAETDVLAVLDDELDEEEQDL
jgi:hypothetical protein